MCGIAGYSLNERSSVDRTLAAQALLHGSMASAWLDEARPELLLARGMGRPIWIGHGRHELLFASTRRALELAERFLRIGLRKRELRDGTLLAIDGGAVVARERF